MTTDATTVATEGDAFQRALTRLGDAGGEAWKPVKDPKNSPAQIAIRILRVEERQVNTSQGAASAIVVTGEDSAGTVTWDVWCWHAVLHSQMVRARPQPGDVIAIAYLGKMQPQGGGNAYENYRVTRADDTAGSAFDWGAFQVADEAPEPAAPEPAAPAAPVIESGPAAATATTPEDDIPF